MHNEIVNYLNTNVSGCNAIAQVAEIGDSSVVIDPTHIYAACESLRDGEQEMNVLQVMTGTDYTDYIEVTYILASFTKNTELLLKVKLPKENSDSVPAIDSICGLWKAANFLEREVFDMNGVTFNNHPDHRRILCPDDWEGYPLRQDYVVQETYHGMTVNPPEKTNVRDHFFYKEVMEGVEDPKKVSFSWKPASPKVEVKAETEA